MELSMLVAAFGYFDSRRANAEDDAWFSTRRLAQTRDALVLRQPPSTVRARMLIVLFHGEI